MAHKTECPKATDPKATCTCGEDKPTTRVCYGCDETIGASEKACPKCKLDLAAADEEDNVVERALARLKKKRKAAPPTSPTPPVPSKKLHPFDAVAKLLGGGK